MSRADTFTFKISEVVAAKSGIKPYLAARLQHLRPRCHQTSDPGF